ncbi:hypothetical protein JSO19_04840 [Leucobacter sp. UCMA 4100]|uniref:hypothetical protein n=1 Tax=Leucobacter sp. UCMA 4100 TaxID=2810534 RepID=UPI0022EA7DCE|nr:hypothetical protein [Leucobacter sp. UCMA 4100]MDA3146699.1 hypothetical protein [Leucobacter sp. UCMA 4100]
MTRVVTLTGHVPAPNRPGTTSEHSFRDVYDLPDLDLDETRGLVVSSGCDRRFLASHRPLLSDWVRGGGRMLVNGHPVLRIVDGEPEFRKMEFHTPRDLWLTACDEHPIWRDIDRTELLFQTGVPGDHTFETLARIGVAGFYARGYLAGLPEHSTIITGIGPGRLPVDISYPLGLGEVIVHAGNDLTAFSMTDSVETRLGEQSRVYLAEAPEPQTTGDER